MNAVEGAVLHFPLTVDANSITGRCRAVNHGVEFGAPGPGGRMAAAGKFAGKSSYIEVAHCESLNLGTREFSLAGWIHTERGCDVVGDIISKFDSQSRRGFSLSVISHAGVVGAQANYRNVHFGIDDGRIDTEWRDCGRPGAAAKIFALTVFDGELYAGTFEWDGAGHVYRYLGEGDWLDCGSPDASNSVASLAVHEGELYCGTCGYRSEGSSMAPSPNKELGGRVYRYEGGETWIDCGRPRGETRAAVNLTTCRGRLYAGFWYDDAACVYEGGDRWTRIGPEGVKLLALTVYGGVLYGLEQGTSRGESSGVYRYEGGSEWTLEAELQDVQQIYGAATYRGDLYTGTWPHASIYRRSGEGEWERVTPRVGYEREIMGLNVYNGKLYCGALPSASVSRYEDDGSWTFMGILDRSDVALRRVWCLCVYGGRLYGGTLPSGRVRSLQAGRMATYDRVLPAGWHHLAAIRTRDELNLFLDGRKVASSTAFNPADFDLSNEIPLSIGFGVHDYFDGSMCDLRIYDRALDAAAVARLAQLE